MTIPNAMYAVVTPEEHTLLYGGGQCKKCIHRSALHDSWGCFINQISRGEDCKCEGCPCNHEDGNVFCRQEED